MSWKPERVLVGVGGGLGNIVQTTPLIRRLSTYFGQMVDVVIRQDYPDSAALLAGSPHIDRIVPFDPGGADGAYGLVYLTHSFGNFTPSFNCDTVVAARDSFPSGLMRTMHEAEFNLFCARELLGAAYDTGDIAGYFVGAAGRPPRSNDIIGIHAGGKGSEWEAGRWLRKRWPYFKDLVRALHQRGYKVASFGLAAERVGETVDLTQTPLEVTIRNIANCAYFVANDSGLMHVADALGVPLTAIFGPTSTVKNGPLALTSSVIELARDCAPCQFDERFATCTCLADIDPQRVLEHVLKHMTQPLGSIATGTDYAYLRLFP